jgi:RING finger protein 170
MGVMEGVDDEVVLVVSGLVGVVVALAVPWVLWVAKRNREWASLNSSHASAALDAARLLRRQAPATAAAPAAAGPHRGAGVACPICMSAVRMATETAPCGHAFCGECLMAYWDSRGRDLRLLCPIDRRPVHMLLPSFALRHLEGETEAEGAEGGSRSRVAEGIEEYNFRFAGTTPGSWVSLGWSMAVRMVRGFGDLRYVHMMYVVVSFVLVCLYLLLPFDLIPEGAMGVFFFLGLIDDVLLALILFLILGNLYRASLQRLAH